MAPETLLKPTEVALRLRLCRATVYKLCATGRLPCLRIVNSVRVRPEDLEAFIRKTTRS